MEIPFIQMGDLHIATPFKNLPQTISQRRREDIMEAFKAALDMAKARRIPLLFITGDMFENDYITRPVIAEISRLLGTLPDTHIFVTPGNHDYVHNRSFYTNWPWPANVHVFAEPTIERIDLQDIPVSVYGLGWNSPEMYQLPASGFALLERSRLNIAVIHGDTLSQGSASPYLPISIDELNKWGMDYVALGHIHKPYTLTADGNMQPLEAGNMVAAKAAYAGSIEPLDSSETGHHGIIVGTVSDKSAHIELIPLAKRRYINQQISLNGAQTVDDVIQRILACDTPENRAINLYTITLTGRLNPQLIQIIGNVEGAIKDHFFSITFIDQTAPDYDLEYIKEQHRGDIIGMFIERMEHEINTAAPSEQPLLYQALYLGLEALLE